MSDPTSQGGTVPEQVHTLLRASSTLAPATILRLAVRGALLRVVYGPSHHLFN